MDVGGPLGPQGGEGPVARAPFAIYNAALMSYHTLTPHAEFYHLVHAIK